MTDQKPIYFCEPLVSPDYGKAVSDQIATGFLGPGPATEKFADALARYVGGEFVVPTVSGTAALGVAAQALGLKAGDEILVPAYGVISTINAFAAMGLAPKLVEIDRRTGCMDLAALEATITPSTKAVCFVNFSGATGDEVEEAAELCRTKGIPMIEDAACALGHHHGGQAAGTFGDVGIYSFSVPKIITTGQGGAIVTNSAHIRDRALSWIDQGDLEWRKTGINRQVGTNLRFNDILASYGMAQLERIGALLAKKRAAHVRYLEGLDGKLFRVPGDEAPLHNIVFVRDAEKLAHGLKEKGIGTQRPYRTICQHPPFYNLADRRYPNADYWTDHALYLPCGLTLEEEDVDRVVAAIRELGAVLD